MNLVKKQMRERLKQIHEDREYETWLYKEFESTVLPDIYNLMQQESFYDIDYWNQDRFQVETFFLTKAINKSQVLLTESQRLGINDYNNKHPVEINPCIVQTIHCFAYGRRCKTIKSSSNTTNLRYNCL